MIRSFAVVLVCIVSVTVLGQSSTTTTTVAADPTLVADHTPSENLASVAARGPATWITEARQRHQAFIQARITNPRAGEPAGTADGLVPVPEDVTGGATGTGGITGLGGLGDLGGLLDAVGGAGGLGGLVGGLTGTTTGTGGMTLEDLLALRDQLMGGSTAGTTPGKTTTGNGKTASRSMELRGGGGAIGRLPKIEAQSATTTGLTTAQTTGTTTSDMKFLPRLADGLADSFFSALTLGFQSDAFIDYIEAWMRPMFFPQDYVNTDDSSDDTSDDTNNDDKSGSVI